MIRPTHPDSLGAYVLGALDPQETSAVEEHLVTCARCRDELRELGEIRAELDDLPPEALLDGPPEGGDLLLQRTFRQVRAESQKRLVRNRITAGAAAVVIAAALVAGGLVIGRQTAPQPIAHPAPTTAPAGGKTGTGDQGAVRMAATVKPAAGWVRISITVSGIPAGQKCKVIVVAKDGSRTEAGSWLASKAGEDHDTTLDTSALVDPAQVSDVEVENFDGQKLVSVPL
jgi:anti-sigma factor RsiW